MPEPSSSIAAGISATKAVFELIKGVREILRRPEVDAHEVSNRLMELHEQFLDARDALTVAGEENHRLQRELEVVKAQQQMEAELIYGEHTYWRRGADGKLDGPFCITCWDDARKLVRPHFIDEANYGDERGRMRKYICTLHKITFMVPSSLFTTITTS